MVVILLDAEGTGPMRAWCLFATLLVTISSLPAQVAAAATFVISDIQPWGSISGTKDVGILVDMARAAIAVAGTSDTVQVVPASRGLRMLSTGEAQYAINVKSTERARFGRYVMDLFDVPIIIALRTGTQAASLADLKGKTVGVSRSVKYGTAAESDPTIALFEVKDLDLGIKMLAAGRLYGLLGTSVGIRSQATDSNMSEVIGPSLEIGGITFGFQATADIAESDATRNYIAAFQRLKADGVLENIIATYTGSVPTR